MMAFMCRLQEVQEVLEVQDGEPKRGGGPPSSSQTGDSHKARLVVRS